MKVFQNGKEVKGATVQYYSNGTPYCVFLKGDNTKYDPAAFELRESEPAKKTRTTKTKTSRVRRVIKKVI